MEFSCKDDLVNVFILSMSSSSSVHVWMSVLTLMTLTIRVRNLISGGWLEKV